MSAWKVPGVMSYGPPASTVVPVGTIPWKEMTGIARGSAWLAAATVTVTGAEVRAPLVAVRVYVPAVLMVRPLKVAEPLTALTVRVPPSTAPLDRTSVTGPLKVVSMMPEPFSSATVRPKEVFGVTLAGGVVTTRVLSAAGLTVTEADETVIVEVTVSVAVTVWLPAVFRVTLKDPEPVVRVELGGNS